MYMKTCLSLMIVFYDLGRLRLSEMYNKFVKYCEL